MQLSTVTKLEGEYVICAHFNSTTKASSKLTPQ